MERPPIDVRPARRPPDPEWRRWIGFFLALLLVLLIAGAHAYNANKCDKLGGVYFYREFRCVRGVENVEL